MGPFEYISVLTSIIVGLGMAHLLKGIARIVQSPGKRKAYWVHLVWVAFMFFQAVFFWWWEYGLESLEEWTITTYLFVLLFAVLIYLTCALLFPDDFEGYGSYEEYFYSRRRWFFGLMIAFFLVDFIDTLIKGAEYFASLGVEYPVTQGVQITGCAIAFATTNRRYHAGFAVAILAYQLLWAMRNYGTIG
jgi:hypothetical protein